MRRCVAGWQETDKTLTVETLGSVPERNSVGIHVLVHAFNTGKSCRIALIANG